MKTTIQIIIICLFVVSCKKETSPTQTGSNTISVVEKRDSITANYKYNEVLAAAIAVDSTVGLRGITSVTSNTNGTANSWSYRFGMTVPPYRYYHFTATYDSVRFDSTSKVTTGDAFISHAWINSSDAMALAEENGGKQFRTANPNYSIYVGLAEALVPNAKTCWYFTYRSTVNTSVSLHISIDASTGALVNI